MKIAHIINPLISKEGSDLTIAQPITFESMRQAKAFASQKIDVDLLACVFPHDAAIVPDDFIRTSDLKRSVYDIHKFGEKRMLPLIKDILDRLLDSSDADYLIYTNVDIALKPHFYLTVQKYIEQGLDAFVINRRTISNTYTKVDELPLMLAEKGLKHPGFDCFVFKREFYNDFFTAEACIGANWIGRVLITNLFAQTPAFKVFDDEELTFHIGDDRSWKTRRFDDYNSFNEAELIKVLKYWKEKNTGFNKNWLDSFFSYHQAQPAVKTFSKEDLQQDEKGSQKKDPASFKKDDKLASFKGFRENGPWDKYSFQLVNQKPVFIVGYPRSGTTLLQAMLGTQQGLNPLFETHFFDIIREQVCDHNGMLKADAVDDFFELIRPYARLTSSTESFINDQAGGFGISEKMLFELVVRDILFELSNDSDTANLRWVEKTPNHLFFTETLLNYYPGAKIINIFRHPEKAILSRRESFLWGNEKNWPVEKHTERWIDSVRTALDFQSKYPENFMNIRLEDLVVDSNKIMQDLCSFVEVPFDAAKLKKHTEIARKIVHPWEKWKQNTSSELSVNTAKRPDKHMNFKDKLVLLGLTNSLLDKLDYEIDFTYCFKHESLLSTKDIVKTELLPAIDLTNNIHRIENENAKLKQQLIAKEKYLNSLLSQNESAKEQNQKLLGIIEEKEKWLSILKERIDERNNRISEILKQDSVVLTEKEKIQALVDKNENELHDYKKLLNERNRKVQELTKLLQEEFDKKASLALLLDETKKNFNKLESDYKKLSEEHIKLQSTFGLLIKKNEETNQHLKELKQEHQILIGKNNDLQRLFNELSDEISIILASTTWKLGSFIMWPFTSLKDFFRARKKRKGKE